MRTDGKPERDITKVIDNLTPLFVAQGVDTHELAKIRQDACYLAPERGIEAWWRLDQWLWSRVSEGSLPEAPKGHKPGDSFPPFYPLWARKVSAIVQDIDIPSE